MRSSNSKMIGNGITNTTGTPVENGLPQKENLPTIQIDTVPSPPSSPTDLSPASAQSNEEIIDTNQIDIDLEEDKAPESQADDLKESLRSYIEDILSEAMVVAEKKIKFVDFGEDNEVENVRAEEESRQHPVVKEPDETISGEPDDNEIKEAAEKVVQEVLTKAQDTVLEQMEQFEKEIATLDFPITFDQAPEYVKDVASDFVKDIVGKAVAQVEEKAAPNVPFTFEDVGLMKTNGPWYVRVREALLRVLRTACFCAPRRNDS